MNYYCCLIFLGTQTCGMSSINRTGTTFQPYWMWLFWNLTLIKIHPYLCFISYVHLRFSFYRRSLGILHRVRTRTTRLTLVTYFQIKFKIILFSPQFSCIWLTSFILLFSFSFTTSLVLSSTLFSFMCYPFSCCRNTSCHVLVWPVLFQTRHENLCLTGCF